MTEPGYDSYQPPTLRAQCQSCKGSGMLMRQVAVIQLEIDRGGTGLVHTRCPECDGESFLPSFEPPV